MVSTRRAQRDKKQKYEIGDKVEVSDAPVVVSRFMLTENAEELAGRRTIADNWNMRLHCPQYMLLCTSLSMANEVLFSQMHVVISVSTGRSSRRSRRWNPSFQG
jgi:hypothetical protein